MSDQSIETIVNGVVAIAFFAFLFLGLFRNNH